MRCRNAKGVDGGFAMLKIEPKPGKSGKFLQGFFGGKLRTRRGLGVGAWLRRAVHAYGPVGATHPPGQKSFGDPPS